MPSCLSVRYWILLDNQSFSMAEPVPDTIPKTDYAIKHQPSSSPNLPCKSSPHVFTRALLFTPSSQTENLLNSSSKGRSQHQTPYHTQDWRCNKATAKFFSKHTIQKLSSAQLSSSRQHHLSLYPYDITIDLHPTHQNSENPTLHSTPTLSTTQPLPHPQHSHPR